MFDVKSATSSFEKLQEFKANSIADLSTIVMKSKAATQIEGVYNMIFPYLHDDYPTRKEVFDMVKGSFDKHDETHQHNGLKAYSFYTETQETKKDQLELIHKDIKEKVKQKSPVQAIGYGI